MENKTSFSVSVGISLLAVAVSLGILSWINGLTFIA